MSAQPTLARQHNLSLLHQHPQIPLEGKTRGCTEHGGSIGRSAELDVPAIDTCSHCSSLSSHSVQVFARRLPRCFRQCPFRLPAKKNYTTYNKPIYKKKSEICLGVLFLGGNEADAIGNDNEARWCGVWAGNEGGPSFVTWVFAALLCSGPCMHRHPT